MSLPSQSTNPVSTARPSVLIIQRILPPYRLALFQELASSAEFSLTLAYGETWTGSALESFEDPEGIKTTHLSNHFFGAPDLIVYQGGVSKCIDSGSFDTIIAEFNPRIISNMLAFFRARRRKLRFIWWGHGLRPRSGAIAKAMYRWLAVRADALIFYNAEGADKFREMGLPAEKMFVAWNSIDTKKIDTLSRPWDSSERPHILFIGRLIVEKKIDLLIRGFAKACPELSMGTKLVIVGDGPQREALVALANASGVGGRIEFAGNIHEDELLAPRFNSAWISVSPGYIGLSAIHSLAFGVPMLVADDEPHSPEIAAIEAGTNAIFFKAGDVEDLARSLVELSRNPSQLELMSKAGLDTIRQRFSLASMRGSFEKAIGYVSRSR